MLVGACSTLYPDSRPCSQVNTLCRTTGQVIAIVLEKSNNPRLPDDYRLVIKYADQSDRYCLSRFASCVRSCRILRFYWSK